MLLIKEVIENTPVRLDNCELFLFTTPTCSNCKMIEKVFDQKGIHYTEIDATVNQEMVEKYGVVSAPSLLIRNSDGTESVISTVPKIMNFVARNH